MRIRMKVQLSGSRNGQAWPQPGSAIDLPDGEAARLCGAGLAEPASDEVETATPPPAETVTVPTAETSTAPEPETRRGRTRKTRGAEGTAKE